MNSLDIKPEKDFFEEGEFYSFLKQKSITKSDYETVRYLWQNLKMRNLYNVQEVILLLEIVENRFDQMCKKKKKLPHPRKCNSASTLSGCIQRYLSKVIILLLTSSAHAEIFEKTLTDGFSCVNTRLGFDAEILLPNLTQRDHNKINISESLKAFKIDHLKICYKIKLDGEEDYSDWRVIAKNLKLDENNQYGFAMTKPMLVGNIKQKQPDWLEFNLLLETVSLDDKIGHLFVVDIEFDYENADAKQ